MTEDSDTDLEILEVMVSKENSSAMASPLDGLEEKVRKRQAEMQNRIKQFQTKKEVEKAHSNYLKSSVADKNELENANYAVKTWLKNSGISKKQARDMAKQQTQDAWVKDNIPSIHQEANREDLIRRMARQEMTKRASSRFHGSGVTGVKGSPSCAGRGLKRSRSESVTPAENTAAGPLKVPKCSSTSSAGSSAKMSPGTSSIINLEEDISTQQSGQQYANHRDVNDNDFPVLKCPVQNCIARFPDEKSLEMHMSFFKHTPLSIYYNQETERAANISTLLACSQCYQLFKEKNSKCEGHLAGHHGYKEMILLAGYGCPQCLMCFQSSEACSLHMETEHHVNVAYPFSDDMDGISEPFLYPKWLVQNMTDKVKAMSHKVTCMDCQSPLDTHDDYTVHMTYATECSRNRAQLEASMSLSDVFCEFLYTDMCSHCHALIKTDTDSTGLIKTDTDSTVSYHHCCSDGNRGTVQSMECQRFTEYVIRLAIGHGTTNI